VDHVPAARLVVRADLRRAGLLLEEVLGVHHLTGVGDGGVGVRLGERQVAGTAQQVEVDHVVVVGTGCLARRAEDARRLLGGGRIEAGVGRVTCGVVRHHAHESKRKKTPLAKR
jgi:hypothetical protein